METTKTLIDILSGLLVPLIAAITVYIAYQQYQSNRNKLKLDLYDKRFAKYMQVKVFISEIVFNPNQEVGGAYQFHRDTSESLFLFDQDVNDFIESLYIKALELEKIQLLLKTIPPGKRRDEMVERQFELMQWYTQQFDIAKAKFGKYISLKNLI